MDLVARAEVRRAAATAALDPAEQKRLGQFFTPGPAAALIASLPTLDSFKGPIRVLDPGAGSGSLTAAMLARIRAELPLERVHLVAVEADEAVLPALADTLADCETLPNVTTELVAADYIEVSTGLEADPRVRGQFDLVIMNPPYGKLAAVSGHRRALSATGVDCPNLYAAFWALGIQACRPGGQVVAIVPRSWANGTYFSQFRRWLLDILRLDTLHVFESRATVFADTGVLQENVIVCGTVGGQRGPTVTLSTSVGHTDEVQRQKVRVEAVVRPGDVHKFVRFTDGAAAVPAAARHTLEELGITVSTGRVVDFRTRKWLADAPTETSTVPLVYPGNLRAGNVEHPRAIRKPQALCVADPEAHKLLVPIGAYTITKRFSAKEERRRVVAAVWDREDVRPAFENHLNYFHERGKGLPRDLARGLSVWLNSTPLDDLFRTFSGHTQVNAGDLRTLPYPSREHLAALGRALPGRLPPQADLDVIVERVLSPVSAVA